MMSDRNRPPFERESAGDPLTVWLAGLVGIVVLLLLPRPIVRMARRFVLRILLEAVAIVTMGLLTGRAADALSTGEESGDRER